MGRPARGDSRLHRGDHGWPDRGRAAPPACVGADRRHPVRGNRARLFHRRGLHRAVGRPVLPLQRAHHRQRQQRARRGGGHDAGSGAAPHARQRHRHLLRRHDAAGPGDRTLYGRPHLGAVGKPRYRHPVPARDGARRGAGGAAGVAAPARGRGAQGGNGAGKRARVRLAAPAVMPQRLVRPPAARLR